MSPAAPTAVERGTGSVTVTGSTNASETFTITIDGQQIGGTRNTDADTNEVGHINETVQVPETISTGTRAVRVLATSGNLECGNINVTATAACSFTPTSPRQDQEVTITGRNLGAADQTVTLRLDGNTLGGTVQTTAANGGGFSATRTIPLTTSTSGTHNITAQVGTNAAIPCTPENFTVQAAATPTPTPTATATATPTTGPLTGTLTVSDSTPEQGQTITASGSGYEARTDIRITIQSHLSLLANGETDATGAFSISVLIPASTELGAHTLSATGDGVGGGTRVLAAAITVVAPASGNTGIGDSGGGRGLPTTGSALPLASGAVGTALLAGGAALHGWSRRRRSDLDVPPLLPDEPAREPQPIETYWGRATTELGLSTTAIQPGAHLRVTGAGFAADADITIVIAAPDRVPRVLEYARTFPTGTFIVDAHISPHTRPGPRTISATGLAPDGSSHELSATLTVVGIN